MSGGRGVPEAKRLLVASSRNWDGVARLPAMLGAAGFDVDLLDPGRTQASASAWVRKRLPLRAPIEKLAASVLEAAPDYDRVIVCDEFLLKALVETHDPRAREVLPARRGAIAELLDKTRFSAATARAGLRVAACRIARGPEDLVGAISALGGRVVLKGALGAGGAQVRSASHPGTAVVAAAALGYPILVECWVEGRLCLMPCLFEHGLLVAAMAAGKHRTIGAFGPSAVNIMLDVTPAMRAAAERAGAAFGLHGFVSFDFFEESDGADPVLIELNLRPVPQLHLGSRAGADMALALRDVLDGRFDGKPRLGSAAGTVALFPQELRRLRLERGRGAGTMRWLTTPGALADVPWNDPSLVLRHLTRDR